MFSKNPKKIKIAIKPTIKKNNSIEITTQDKPTVNPNKTIGINEFSDLIQHHGENNCSVAKLLQDAGYSLEIADIDCNDLPKSVYAKFLNELEFKEIKFTRCKLPGGAKYVNCIFHFCEMLDDKSFMNKSSNCLSFVSDSVDNQQFTSGQNIKIQSPAQNPFIGVVYFNSQGTYHTDRVISILNQYKVNIIKLTENALTHPIAKDLSFLDGIVLPGGSNVNATQYLDREKLESLLMNTSVENKIPTLGVCRGHQFIGHFFGAEIVDLPSHDGGVIHVPRDNESKLFALTEKKFKTQTRKRRIGSIETEEGGYKYVSSCLHGQGLFFHDTPPPEKKVKITARTSDNLPECLEVDDHIISFQHHHESCQNDLIAKSSMNMYAKMVFDFHEKKNSSLSMSTEQITESELEMSL